MRPSAGKDELSSDALAEPLPLVLLAGFLGVRAVSRRPSDLNVPA